MGKLVIAAARFLLLCAVFLLFLTIMFPDRAFAQQPTLANNPTQGPPRALIPVLGNAHQAITVLTQMITLAMQNGGEGQDAQLEALKQQIEALPKPKRGDRKAARLHNDKGLEAFKKEQHEQALQFFLTAYQLDPGDVEVINNIGMAYLKTGNLPEAARHLGGALSLAPTRAAAWGNLAEVFAHDSRPEEAVAAYALTYRYSKNKDATRRFIEAQTTNADDPQVMQAAKVALALPLISGRTEAGESAPTPRPQEGERPQQEAASQQAIQSAASRCTGEQIEKMINAGFSKQEIMRLCETITESPAKGTLSSQEAGGPETARKGFEAAKKQPAPAPPVTAPVQTATPSPQEAKRPQQEAVSQQSQAIQSEQPEVMGKFRWLQTPQNCSVWVPTNFSPNNITEIGSCKEGKAYGRVVFKSASLESGDTLKDNNIYATYFYDGFAVSDIYTVELPGKKEPDTYQKERLKCFEYINAYKPKLHALHDKLYPVVYLDEISGLSDNRLVSIFGAGTKIWMDIAHSKGLCYQQSFGYIKHILVGIQNASKFADVPEDIVEHLTRSVYKLTLAKVSGGKLGGAHLRSEWDLAGLNKTVINIMDDKLSETYVEANISKGNWNAPDGIGQVVRNYVQQAIAAERARKQEAERRAQIKERFDNFFQKTESTELVEAESLQSNPFRYEGTNIVVVATYRMMLDKNTSLFETRNGILAVSGLDPKHSIGQGAKVLLAGKVTGTGQVPTPMGGSITAPRLSFRDIHVCQTNDCADILP